MFIRGVCLICAVILLSACQSAGRPPAQVAVDEAIADSQPDTHKVSPLKDIPADVSRALQPSLPEQRERVLFGEPRYDIKAEATAARAFFAGLIKDSPYSIAIHPEVSGNITLDLKQVRLQDVFDLVSELYGYDVQRKGNVYRIYPAGMRTETFSVNYLLMQRDGVTTSSISSGGVSQFGNNNNRTGGTSNFSGNNQGSNQFGNSGSQGGVAGNGTNISTSTRTNFWEQLQSSLLSLIGTSEGRSVVVSPQAGLVTVRAMPDELREVRKFLEASQSNIQRQVVLEARIIELTLDDEYQQGINWTQVLSHAGSTDFRFSATGQIANNTISGGLGGISSLAFVNQDFSGVVSLLSTQGNVQVLSSPRVTAINNQKAVIKVGNDEYFVTDVSNQSTTNASTTSSSPDIELTPFFSGIALDVTPQIDDKGGVLLHVHPSVVETQEQEKIVTINQEQLILPLAQSNIRESDTVIHAKSGEIVVIGGLMQTSSSEVHSKTPILGSVPILGELFKNRREIEQKRELVILIKPTVVDSNTWKQQLLRSQEYLADWLYVE
ncbi:pilus (MSHA type) biogenesis protein MshL [Paraneptunicella aestuarii]|uniref:pilus (MSHA type) biogenesis protein MshL n=1 Tax=Paraneptunicella aestuarii TaxID=2831148 RepID=UPI001E3E2C15|nr:pilus (MSHA type) biogenesis protein MshL [Paraneptunicella aestuarii]UAA39087.1 pilus (MSHA type) biogenesis protein MshL [Paraneptunicella aestuarii]